MATQNQRDYFKWALVLSIAYDVMKVILTIAFLCLPIITCTINGEEKNISQLASMVEFWSVYFKSKPDMDPDLKPLILVFSGIVAIVYVIIIILFVFDCKTILKHIFTFFNFHKVDKDIDDVMEGVNYGFTLTPPELLPGSIDMPLLMLFIFFVMSSRIPMSAFGDFSCSILFISGFSWWFYLCLLLFIPYLICWYFFRKHIKASGFSD